ncbi:hypothetical protein CSV75_09515 [Sporosarcina sp. P18a]|uniref:hypothetical protein n=1 Tax=Sporosarcina sp. P18a TaxID=2048259 RepID=UPI000C170E8F|nr:hypothetical protein [Sporosarcina sp. P18a]PIC80187.1 hypothetical protein CSV75_09515 [Sporosarcina sp. P18a]
MDIIKVIFLILLWGIPISLSIISYRKATEEERHEIIKDLKRPSSLLGLCLASTGVMVLFSGSISQINWLFNAGVIMLIIGVLNAVIIGWIKQEIKLIRGIWVILWLAAFTIAFVYLT